MIFIIAFTLRIWGVWFGLPHSYHADEPIVVNHALAFGIGDLNPHFFKIPPLVSYLLFIVYGFYFLFARVFGWVRGVEGFEFLFITDPSSFYLLGRFAFGTILGVATVHYLRKLATHHFSKEHGLIAGFFLATNFLHVRDSHYIYADIPLVLVLVLSFFEIFRILEKDDKENYVLFGLLAGLATATKYNGIFIMIPFYVAHLLGKGLKLSTIVDKRLILACLVALAAYSILNPFSWLDFNFFWKEVSAQAQVSGKVGALYHLTYSLAGGVGWPILATGILGLLVGIGEKKRLAIATFVISYYLLLVFRSQPYDRYVLPLVPFVLFFAADFILRVGSILKCPRSVIFLLAFFVAFPSLIKSVLADQILSRKDVRTIAEEWTEAEIPAGTKIAIDNAFYMPPLKPTIRQLKEKKEWLLSHGSGEGARVRRVEILFKEAEEQKDIKRYELYFLKDHEDTGDEALFSKPSIPYDLAELRKQGIQYVFIPKLPASLQRGSFYQELASQATPVKDFSPYKKGGLPVDLQPLTGGPFLWEELKTRERNGHTIVVYKLS